MEKYRTWGKEPYKVVVVHGGPGAIGEMGPLGRYYQEQFGVLEPFQSKYSIDELAGELADIIMDLAEPPVYLVGHSWGAMLSYIMTSQYPALVKKLILIGSAVYDRKFARDIMKVRLERLSGEERDRAREVFKNFKKNDFAGKELDMKRIIRFVYKADNYDPIVIKSDVVRHDPVMMSKVWSEAEELRDSGKLLTMGKSIKCPVTVIHGDYDPHQFDGVYKPLIPIVPELKTILLEKCGHTPWVEKQARDNFFEVLSAELDE